MYVNNTMRPKGKRMPCVRAIPTVSIHMCAPNTHIAVQRSTEGGEGKQRRFSSASFFYSFITSLFFLVLFFVYYDCLFELFVVYFTVLQRAFQVSLLSIMWIMTQSPTINQSTNHQRDFHTIFSCARDKRRNRKGRWPSQS